MTIDFTDVEVAYLRCVVGGEIHNFQKEEERTGHALEASRDLMEVVYSKLVGASHDDT